MFGCANHGMQWTRGMDQGAILIVGRSPTTIQVLVVCREDYQWRRVGKCADIWYEQIQPTETVEV